MLKEILKHSGLQPDVAADLLGVQRSLFSDWVYGKRAIPSFILPELASIFGVTERDLACGTALRPSGVWFKFSEGDELIDADREIVVLVRRLGHYLNELEQLTNSGSDAWKVFFGILKQDWEHLQAAAPAEQGLISAARFRKSQSMGHAVVGIGGRIVGAGDLIRKKLRDLGILVIESPIPASKLRGCSFYVGWRGAQRPCLFVNTYKQDWFQRNSTLVHELAHAVFDIETEQALLDYRDSEDKSDLLEVRADSFARGVFVPESALTHLTSTQGLKWDRLTASDLAVLVAYTQVDLRNVLHAAVHYGFCKAEDADHYKQVKFNTELKQLTERALTTKEFIKKQPPDAVLPWTGGRRTTTIPIRSLRLPVSYVNKVLEAYKSRIITTGKAAEMLMMEPDDFTERFEPLMLQVAV